MQSLLLPFAGIAPVVDGGDKLDVEDEFDGSDAHAHARLLTSTTVAASFFHPAAILVSRAEGFEGLALVFKLAFDILALDPLDSTDF